MLEWSNPWFIIHFNHNRIISVEMGDCYDIRERPFDFYGGGGGGAGRFSEKKIVRTRASQKVNSQNVFVLSCVCYVFVRVCLYVLCGHLLGKC